MVKFAVSPEDKMQIAQLCDKIRQRLNNPYFFNWTSDSFLLEAQFSKVLFKTLPHLSDLAALEHYHESSNFEIVSFVAYRELDDSLEIMVLGTHPEHLRQGHQKQLIDQLINTAQMLGAKIWLEVHEQNQSAIDFYLKCGFKKISLRKNYYQDSAAALVMSYEK